MDSVLKIKGYETRYSIDLKGNIESLPIRIKCRGGAYRVTKPKKIKSFVASNGYLAVDLTSDGKKKRHYIHRLIYSHFVSEIPKGMVINHKDNNPLNNEIVNLECVTQRDNVRHYWSLKKGSVGVFLDNPKRGKRKYRASIWNERKIELGRYDTEEDAKKAIENYIIKNLNHLKYK